VPLNLDQEIDLNVRIVAVPEFGADASACIAEMTADEQDERLWITWNSFKERTGQKDNRRFRAFAVASTLCDENRKFTYSADQIQEAATKLAGKSAKAVQRLYLAASQLNGIGDVEVEEIQKN
jgi:hypothetical protein